MRPPDDGAGQPLGKGWPGTTTEIDRLEAPEPRRQDTCEAGGLGSERAFIGCLLALPASVARTALEPMNDTAFLDYSHEQVVGIIRQLAGDGVDPCPQAVLAHARRHGLVAGADATQALAQLLLEIFGSAPTPASWAYFRAAVLDEALRRRSAEMATRIGQAAARSSMEALAQMIDAEYEAVRQLRHRADGPERVAS